MYLLFEVCDVDGDGFLDFVFLYLEQCWNCFWVVKNFGSGVFSELFELFGGLWCDFFSELELFEWVGILELEIGFELIDLVLVYFGDFDGDGVVEYVEEQQCFDLDVGMCKEMCQVKNFDFKVCICQVEGDDFVLGDECVIFDLFGYFFDSLDEEFLLFGGFEDLNGDGC